MATRKKTAASSKKKRTPKKVIEHDPLSATEEVQQDEGNVQADREIADVETKDAGNVIELGSSLVISDVEAYHATLLAALQKGSDLVVDGGDIQQIDGAGLQLLAAFALEAKRMCIVFKWQAASPVLCEGSEQLGLSDALQLKDICKAA